MQNDWAYAKFRTTPLWDARCRATITICDFPTHKALAGLGPICAKDYQRGFFVHSALALTPSRVPLGPLLTLRLMHVAIRPRAIGPVRRPRRWGGGPLLAGKGQD